tara:strand:- start:190 stop:810 length:621 start_codon:yes stop_codon:yes gene_type:complete
MPIVFNGSTGVITGVSVGGLPDGIVDTDMIANGAVTSAKATGIGGGITEADSWRINSNFSAGTGTNTINANWERDDTNFQVIGTGLSHDGYGKFGFQVTGKYLLSFFFTGAVESGNDARYAGIRVYSATDGINGSYNEIAQSLDSVNAVSSGTNYAAGSMEKILDVTNTNTFFYMSTYTTGSITWRVDGNSSKNVTGFTAFRLGDT